MTTLYEKLIAAGFPIESASDEKGVHLTPGAELTLAQSLQMSEIILEHQNPAGYAGYLEEKTIAGQFRDEYSNTITTLKQIEEVSSLTNAQVVAAVKFLAKTLRLLLRLLARQYMNN